MAVPVQSQSPHLLTQEDHQLEPWPGRGAGKCGAPHCYLDEDLPLELVG